MQDELDTFMQSKEDNTRKKFNLLAKQIGLNTTHLTEEECAVLMKALEKSDMIKNSRGKGRGKGK